MFVTIEVHEDETVAQALARELARFDVPAAKNLGPIMSEDLKIAAAPLETSMEEILKLMKQVIDTPGLGISSIQAELANHGATKLSALSPADKADFVTWLHWALENAQVERTA